MTTNTAEKEKPVLGDEGPPVEFCRLSALRLNARNPRLGARAGLLDNQVKVLDSIVNDYGIDDLLSSIAVNGYFRGEPLVGTAVEEKGAQAIRIEEGNRRLAACLILAGDPRARNHEKRTRDYQELQKKHGKPPIQELPVILPQDPKGLLSYMGVRHIAAAQPWDSYAKASWAAQILEEGKLTLQDLSEMIGDQHRTVARLLEGFYLVNQLVEAAHFKPSDSMRRGRGSNPEYPFSWVYTALGYGPVRQWLSLPDLSKAPKKTPVPKDRLADAADLMVFLLGKRSANRGPSIVDSRQIAVLARIVADPQGRRMLRKGLTVDQVYDMSRPALDRVSDSLLDAEEALKAVLGPLAAGEVTEKEARDLLGPCDRILKLAREVKEKVARLAIGEEKP
ncbi:MAG TPA: hypothetical protein VNE39_12275 [Planctomycetota bacterium]|nr:hypothetical protein [Planctomycetota bacterium]